MFMSNNPFYPPDAGEPMRGGASPRPQNGTHAPSGREFAQQRKRTHVQDQNWPQGQTPNVSPGMHPLVARQRASTRYEQYHRAGQEGGVRAAAIQSALEIIPMDESSPAVAEFMERNPKTGYLKIQVSALQGAIPIADADIKIYLDIGGVRHLLVTDQSNRSGLTGSIPLPAPDKRLTLDPSSLKPYSSYILVLEHPDFARAEINEVPIFDGITSVQQVNMVAQSW